MSGETLRIFACGDLMTGRGIDQILRHPSDPRIFEDCVTDARDYVALAEHKHGAIPRGVGGDYLWQDIQAEWERRAPLVKIANLETAVTECARPWPGRGINYRMHPGNIDLLTSAGFDILSLANNHVLDWDLEGLEETLRSLDRAGISHAGAGRGLEEAEAPVQRPLPGGGRLLLYAAGTPSSGIPAGWAAGPARPGVFLLPALDEESLGRIAALIRGRRETGDFVVLSIHWGGNWGYEIPEAHRAFARRLVEDCGVNLVHGHSSHHPLALEIAGDAVILYGCGDFINDYEGIGSFGTLRSDIAMMYFLEYAPPDWRLQRLQLLPLQMRRFQLRRLSAREFDRQLASLNRICAARGSRFEADGEDCFTLMRAS